MVLDRQTCLRALRTHDSRFDGCFFVGVSSTRIYCRPVCRVKPPKPENCTFFSSAAAAEAAGYRPCLRCRPELAPGNASVDASRRLAYAAASLIEDGLPDGDGLEGLAARLQVTPRHLRRVFHAEFGVTPVAFAQTQRLLLAKRLLTDTTLPITEVAFASGFQSLRRFNAVLRERYRLAPQQVRKSRRTEPPSDTLVFELSYRPPFDWDGLLQFLGNRTIAGVEQVDAGIYRRIVRIAQRGKTHVGWVEVRHDPRKNVVRVVASSSLAKVIPQLLAKVKCLFDLSCNPEPIHTALGKLAADRPGLRLPGSFDGFEVAVRAILGQQISVAAARTLAGRFASAFGTPIETPDAALTTSFPAPQTIATLAAEDLVKLGILKSRALTIIEIAKALAAGSVHLAPGADANTAIEGLQAIRGIGEWTAQYIAMRALAWPDAFPHSDLGVIKALNEKNPRRILAAAEPWRPWRAYAVMHLWAGGTPDELLRRSNGNADRHDSTGVATGSARHAEL